RPALGLLPPLQRAARTPPLRAGPPVDRRPVRPRRGETDDRGAAGARRLSAPRPARTPLLRWRGRPRARPAAPPAAARRLRPPQRPRLSAGRVAAARPLALDRAARRADGEGARGLATRRGRRPARRRPRGRLRL